METMKRLFGIALMLMVSMVTSAEEKEPLVKFDTNEFTGGTVEKKSEQVVSETEADPELVQVIFTVTPDPGFYITKDDIVVMATYPLPPTPAGETRGDGDGEQQMTKFTEQLQLTQVDVDSEDADNPMKQHEYSVTVEKGFGVWVTEAHFKQAATSGELEDSEVTWSLLSEEKGSLGNLTLTLSGKGSASLSDGSAPWALQASAITKVVIGAEVTALGADILSGCNNLTSVEIQNAKSVITLGEGAIPGNKSLAVNVPGNILNMYLMDVDWNGFYVDSDTKVQMGKVKFLKDKNEYDVFASSEKDKTLAIPVGVTGYSITGVQGSKILYKEVSDIKAGDVVLLFSDKIQTNDEFALYTAYAVQDATETPETKEGNNEKSRTRAGEGSGDETNDEKEPVVPFALKVVKEDPDKKAEDQGLDVKLGQVYMLYNDVFYPTQAGRIPVGGIYLEEVADENAVPKDIVNQKSFSRLYLTFAGDDSTTAVVSHLSPLTSRFSDAWYDLSGRKFSGMPTAKGVYINGGKKYIIK